MARVYCAEFIRYNLLLVRYNCVHTRKRAERDILLFSVNITPGQLIDRRQSRSPTRHSIFCGRGRHFLRGRKGDTLTACTATRNQLARLRHPGAPFDAGTPAAAVAATGAHRARTEPVRRLGHTTIEADATASMGDGFAPTGSLAGGAGRVAV